MLMTCQGVFRNVHILLPKSEPYIKFVKLLDQIGLNRKTKSINHSSVSELGWKLLYACSSHLNLIAGYDYSLALAHKIDDLISIR